MKANKAETAKMTFPADEVALTQVLFVRLNPVAHVVQTAADEQAWQLALQAVQSGCVLLRLKFPALHKKHDEKLALESWQPVITVVPDGTAVQLIYPVLGSRVREPVVHVVAWLLSAQVAAFVPQAEQAVPFNQ